MATCEAHAVGTGFPGECGIPKRHLDLLLILGTYQVEDMCFLGWGY